MSQYLSEAFKRLDILNEETFSISNDGIADYQEFVDTDEIDDTVDVIDMEAETEDDIQDSYVGKVILDCCVCHSKIYKDVEDVVIEDDLANVGEECPFCYTPDGYKVIGQVAEFGQADEDEKDDDKDIEDTDDVELDESLLTEGKLIDNVKKVATRVGADAVTIARCFTELGEIIKNIGKDGDDYKSSKVNDWMEHIENKAALKALMSGNEQVMNGCTKEDIEDLAKDVQDYIDEKKAEKSKKDNVNEGLFGKKKERTQKTIKAADLKKGMILLDDDREIKVQSTADDDGTHIAVGYKTGSMSIPKHHDVTILEGLTESVNNINVETDTDVINVTPDENGKVTISTEPKTDATLETGEETIQPLEPDTQSEISDNVADGEEIEIDVDEFDEESFDELGEGYLKKVYENVNSFKTSKVSIVEDKLIVEGVIKFNSGNSKKTNFIFESKEATKSGKVRFIGENKEISRGKKSFTVTGKIADKKFMAESFNYNYGVRGTNGKTQRLYGTVKRGK